MDTNNGAATMNNTKHTARYIYGDKAVYTGKTEMLYGALAYEARYVEGHRKGEIITTYKPPNVD